MAGLAHAIALTNPLVTADVVEAQEFPSLSQRYGVRSVPLTVINEVIRFAGAVPEAAFIEKVLQAGVKQEE